MRSAFVSRILGLFGLLGALAIPTGFAAAAGFGANLVANGDAEGYVVSSPSGQVATAPGWAATSALATVRYGASGGFPYSADPGPADRGQNFFAGGDNAATSSASQRIDVGFAAADIDANGVKFDLSAWLGGYTSQADYATVTVSFLDAGANVLGQATIGPVTAADRQGKTALLQRAASGAVPPHTRGVQVDMVMTRFDGSYNDGYVDNVSLVFTKGGQSSAASDSDRVFNYAQAVLPQYFAPANSNSGTLYGYYYRYYSATNSYIGTKDGELYYLGPASQNEIVDLGTLAEAVAEAAAAGF